VASLRKQIMDGIEAALSGLPNVTGVYRSRVIAYQREETPAVYIRLLGEIPRSITYPYTDKDMSFEVGVIVRAPAVDIATDEIAVEIHSRLLSEPTIGGLCIDTTEEGSAFDEDDADGGAVALRMRFRSHYRHFNEALDQH